MHAVMTSAGLLQEDLKPFLCAISDDEHFAVEKPVTLLCSHAVCLACIESFKVLNGTEKQLKCRLCLKESKIDYDVICESIFVKHFISSNCEQLFSGIRGKYENVLKNLRVKLGSMKETTGAQIEYFKDEIDIKVESLKLELEDLRVSLIHRLDEFKKEFDDYTAKIDLQEYEDYLTSIVEDRKKNQLNDLRLKEFQNELKNLSNSLECLNGTMPQVTCSFSADRLTSSIIGIINYNFKNPLKSFLFSNQKTTDLSTNPYGLCTLPNKNILIANPVQKNMTLYSPTLSLINTIDKINYRGIQPRYLSTDQRNRLFISQSDHHKITVTDLNFNFIAEIGGKGTSSSQFNYPLGIFHYSGSLYVCDGENKRIQKFTEDLTFQESYPLDFKPLSVRVINNFACIRSNSEDFIYFYSLKPLKLMNKLSICGHSAIYSTQFWFYVFDAITKQLNCYDLNGRLVSSASIQFQFDVSVKEKVSFEIVNDDSLVFISRLARKLVFFS